MLTLDQLGISEEDWNQTPASVRVALMFLIQQNQRLENRCATYELQVQRLEAELERLKKLELEVAELRERLGQNSQNSSKPPSSDPPSVSRPGKHQPSGRKQGGQRGHQGHGRALLQPEQVDRIEAIKQRGGTSAEIGEKLLEQVEALFDLWRQLRAGSLSREAFEQEMKSVQSQVKGLVERGATCDQAKTRRTCENLLKHEVSLWTFVREAGVCSTSIRFPAH